MGGLALTCYRGCLFKFVRRSQIANFIVTYCHWAAVFLKGWRATHGRVVDIDVVSVEISL